jgi:adenine-specific DNA-methyltransferase
MRDALEELKRLQSPYLNWAGKAERTSFVVDTVSLHVHERIDPASILSAVRKAMMKGGKSHRCSEPKPSSPACSMPLREPAAARRDRLLPPRTRLGQPADRRRQPAGDEQPPAEGEHGRPGADDLHRPALRHQVRLNFQPFVGKRDVKDRNDEDLTQEPEMIKAFRDTWELGIHSYLTYLRDRLLLARELLTASRDLRRACSCRCSASRTARITVKKTGGQTSELLPRVADYLLWYCRLRSGIKYRVFASRA